MPEFTFLTSIFHPNVDDKGEADAYMLGKEEWKPASKIRDVILKIPASMIVPNFEGRFSNFEAWHLFIDNPEEFKKKAAAETKKYAMHWRFLKMNIVKNFSFWIL